MAGALATLSSLVRKHKVDLIAIGNGTASRETDRLAAALISDLPAPKPTKVVVSEAGASVYSASELAAREFPGLDVSLRGAVSIARRLQDPLAELVKIEPKSIGVGQYQHDVDQGHLAKALDAVVEDAVNAVGVDLNTASAPLLSRVSGLGPSLAEAIVAYRDVSRRLPQPQGADGSAAPRRQDLRAGGRLSAHPRWRRAAPTPPPLHPEAYGVARRIVAACGRDIRQLMGDSAVLKALNPAKFVDERFGLPTVRDILSELEKPGRDPRARVPHRQFRRRGRGHRRSQARHGSRGNGDQCRRLRRPSVDIGVPSGTASFTSASWPLGSSRTRATW